MGNFWSKNKKKQWLGDPSEVAYGTTWGVIRIVHLGSQKAPTEQKVSIDFKAFIRRFTDDFNAGFKTVQYPNQRQPIANQSTPRRSIILEWFVPSASEHEALINLQKCSALANMTMPLRQHVKNDAHMHYPHSSFVAIKFANLIQSPTGAPLPGFIDGFSFSPNFEEGTFVSNEESSMRKSNKKFGHYLPKIIDISLRFTPFLPNKKSAAGYNVTDKKWGDPFYPYGVAFAGENGIVATAEGASSIEGGTAAIGSTLDAYLKGITGK